MEKSSAEDDCVDSGAETGGSDYSPLSSTSSEFSMGELQDPFLVSVHLLAEPGQGKSLQRAADGVLAWVHPELQLFTVSERAAVSQRSRPRRHQNGGPGTVAAAGQPAMAVILFLQEACGGEETILTLHRALQRPPWRYHHTEKVSNGRRMLPLTPCSQDFFTLAPGTPLWAVRQVHYGKEIIRFTLYCRHQNYGDMVRLYKLLLQRRVAQKKEDFCFLVVYSNPDMEIQLSFKRLPRGQSPSPQDSAVMEVRVRDVGVLVPLLPRPCSPISNTRWQTEDYDGNKILLQVQLSHSPLRLQDQSHRSYEASSVVSVPPTYIHNPNHHKNRRYQQRAASRPRPQASSHSSPPLEAEAWPDDLHHHHLHHHHHHPDSWRPQRSGSIFSLPNLNSAGSCHSTGSSPSRHNRSHSLHRRSSLVPQFRLNVDALIGAEETDVDTGDKIIPNGSGGGDVDLTVVSAYIKSSLPQTSRPLSAPPEDVGASTSPSESVYRSATLGRVPACFSLRSTPSTLTGSRPHSAATTSAAASSSDISINQSDSCSIISVAPEEEEEEKEDEDQEFYI